MPTAHIHIGKDLPPYFWETIRQTRRFSTGPIYLVIPQSCCELPEVSELDCRAITCESFENLPKIVKLKSVSFLNKYGLGDFWHVTMQRLFVLEELMIREQLTDVLHLENDVTIYFDPELLQPTFQRIYNNSVAVVPLGPSEGCTAAVLYAHGTEAIGKVTSRMIELLQLGEKAIMKKLWRSQMVHEMMLLGIIQHEMPSVLKAFPILPQKPYGLPVDLRRTKPIFRIFARLFDKIVPLTFGSPKSFELTNFYSEIKLVFDPLSIGQYLGGHSPAHKDCGKPVIHKNHWLAPDLAANTYEIVWRPDSENRRCPFLKETSGEEREWKIANLHVHCKRIEDFV